MNDGSKSKRDRRRKRRRPSRRCWLVAASWALLLAVILEPAAAEVTTTELDLEELRDERRDLLVLRDTLRSALDLHSNWTGPPCHGGARRSRWRGVSCDGDGRVVGVALDGARLTGALPRDFLRGVARLESLSLRGNALRGALPALEALPRLRAVDLSSNRFSGAIPRGYATSASLRGLVRLELQDNLLSGTLPAFDQRGLAVFNVSYNFLRGQVPHTRALSRFPPTAFGHNLRLCGEAVNAECRQEAPAPYGGSSPAVLRPPGDDGDRARAARRRRRPARFRLAAWSVAAISLIAALVPFAAVLIFLHQKKKNKKKSQEVRLGGRGRASAAAAAAVTAAAAAEDIKDKVEVDQGRGSGGSRRSTESGKGAAELQFFRAADDDGAAASFDLDELFRSTADMLGKGRLGITYRVTLQQAAAGPGHVVVVKQLRNMSHVPRREFTHTMQLLGKLRHENLAGLVACFYSKDEKLAVYEHVSPGSTSLFQLLHGNRGEGRTPLPWAARLSIAQGMARGLEYLHRSLPHFHRPPHGNLKSSNVLVFFAASTTNNGGKQQQQQKQAAVAKLTDHGLHPLLRPHHAHRLAGAKCPEFARRGGGGRRLPSRADVYCLGLVLLELVTGKVPVEEDGDLAEWARLALSHEWSTDILDVEIVGDRGRHGDMLRLTEVALLCATVEPDRRPKVQDVVRMIDDIAAGAGDGPELA